MNVFNDLVVRPVSEGFVEEVEQQLHLEKAAGVKPAKRIIDVTSDIEDRLSLEAQAEAEGWQSHWHKWLELSCEEDAKHNYEGADLT
jgi:hypothetical protein